MRSVELATLGKGVLSRRRMSILYAAAVIDVVILGAFIRFSFILHSNFPINDGGLFYVMVRDLQRNNFALPRYTTYNYAHIPYAYPPFSFYLLGVITKIFNWNLLSTFRFFPALTSSLTILAFVALARPILKNPVLVVFASFAFALLPQGFEWEISGGGVTRSLGMLFAVLALREAYSLYTRDGRRRLITCIVLSSLTVVTHPEFAWFLVYSTAVFLFALGRSREGIARSAVLVVGTAVCSAPWWATIVMRFGPWPILSATHGGWPLYGGAVDLLLLRITYEPLFPVIGALALLGLVWAVAKRRYLLPLWLLVTLIVDPRNSYTSSSVVVALLAGVGLYYGLLPLTRALQDRGDPRLPGFPVLTDAERNTQFRANTLARLVIALIACYSVFAALVSHGTLLSPISRSQRIALAWVRQKTPAGSRFIIPTVQPWNLDKVSEWFPALTNRVSVATVQGYEWAGNGVFQHRINESLLLEKCSDKTANCLEKWAASAHVTYDYVFLPKVPLQIGNTTMASDAFHSLRTSLAQDSQYRRVYDGAGATIYRRLK